MLDAHVRFDKHIKKISTIVRLNLFNFRLLQIA